VLAKNRFISQFEKGLDQMQICWLSLRRYAWQVFIFKAAAAGLLDLEFRNNC
jgi:hypothetical protein